MSGASIIISVQDREARDAFQKLGAVMENTTPVMRAIGVGLIENTHQRFERAVDPDGAPWAKLNPDYAAGKRGPGILRESAMRGGLMGSITQRASRDSVEIGTNKIYAAVHQFGATIRPRTAEHLVFRIAGRLVFAESVTIKARPFLGVSREDEETILDVVEGFLRRAVGAPVRGR